MALLLSGRIPTCTCDKRWVHWSQVQFDGQLNPDWVAIHKPDYTRDDLTDRRGIISQLRGFLKFLRAQGYTRTQ